MRPRVRPRLLVGLLLACTLAVPVWMPDDVDLWWLLATGRWMVENRDFPRADPFSFTARGEPWALHESLFALVSYGIERACGTAGLVAAELALVVAVFGSLLAAHRALRAPPLASAFFAFAALMSMRTRITLRPELVSLLFFVWTLAALDLREAGERRPARALPILFVVWSNLHSGCVYGLAAIGLRAAGSLFDGWARRGGPARGERGTREAARLGSLLVICVLATFANPLGASALGYPLRLLTDPFMRSLRIEELEPTPLSLNYLDFWALALLVAAMLVLGWRRARVSEVLLLLATGYLALRHVRSIGLFALASASTLPRWTEGIVARFPAESGRVGRILGPGLALVMALVLASSLRDHLGPGRERLDRLFPLKAAAFIEREELPGPMYNSQVWGGWLIWRFYGERPVYFDGRNDVYLHAFDNSRGFSDPANLGRFGIRLGLVPIRGAEAPRLFSNRADWALVYWDDLAAVFARREEPALGRIERLEYRFVQPWLGVPGIQALDARGREAALIELRRKAAQDPGCRFARILAEAAMLGAGPADRVGPEGEREGGG